MPITSGDILVRGKKVSIRSTQDAIANGIETIYQDSALVIQLSIARNLFLGREPITGPRFLNRLDYKQMDRVAQDLLKRVGISKNIPPYYAYQLAVGRRASSRRDCARDVFRERPHHTG